MLVYFFRYLLVVGLVERVILKFNFIFQLFTCCWPSSGGVMFCYVSIFSFILVLNYASFLNPLSFPQMASSSTSAVQLRTWQDVDFEIGKWKADLVQSSSSKVFNGCILHLFCIAKTPPKTLKHFSELIGYAVDRDKFNSRLRYLIKLRAETKRNVKTDTIFKHFLLAIAEEWEVVRQRAPEEIDKRNKLPPPPKRGKKKPPLPRQMRSDCPKCPQHQAKIESLEASIIKLKEDLSKKTLRVQTQNQEIQNQKRVLKATRMLRLKSDRELASERLKVEKVSEEEYQRGLKCKRLAEKIKKRDETLKKVRSKKNNFHSQLKLKSRDPSELATDLKCERLRLTWRDKKIIEQTNSIAELKDIIKNLKKDVKELQIQNDDLMCTLNSPDPSARESDSVRVREYDPDVRRVIYEAIHSKVPIANASELIATAVTTLTSAPAPVLPSPSTISRMSAEIGIISYVQAAETMLNSNNQSTLAWDATTLAGVHINEVHIQTTEQTFTIAIDALPGGATHDYVAHITGVIDNMAEIFSSFKGLDPVTVKTSIVDRIGSTCTDRANVNSAVVRELRDLWQTDLVELHCNLHPLDSFASKIRGGLKTIDADWELKSTGRDCCVSNFLYGLSKLKIKETGDPAGFTSWLLEHGIPPSQIVRYVGNKWNVLFWMPSFVLEHRVMLSEYLEKYCRTETALRTDLLWAITDEKVQVQLRALALIGKIITTPWMEEFYGNKKRLSNLQMVPKLKHFSQKLEEYVNDPSLLLSSTETIFAEPFKQDRLLIWLQDSLPSEDLYTCLKMMLTSIQDVSDRQLHRYTKGELSNITPELLEATKASTPHNVWAERTLGALNALWDRAKQASISFLEKRVITASNHIMAFLDGLDETARHALIKFAVKKGSVFYKRDIQARKDLKIAAVKKTRQVGQKRDMERRKKLEKSVAGAMISKDAGMIAEFKGDELYKGLEEEERLKVNAIIEGKSLKGVCVSHDWLEEDDKTETYHGEIVSTVKRSNGLISYRIRYWLPGLRDESLSFNNIQAEKLVIDILLGDLRVRQ